MKSLGLRLCCAQGNTEWVPDCGTGANPKGRSTTAAWGSGEGCSHQGGPHTRTHWWLHQYPRSFANSPLRGEAIIPGRSQMPRHQLTAPRGRMGFPQTVASPKATKCPTEK